VRAVKRLLVSTLLFLLIASYANLHSVVVAGAEKAGTCRTLFTTYVSADESVFVFKTNYDCFSYVIENFYVYISPDSSIDYVLLDRQVTDLLYRAWNSIKPGDLELNVVMLNFLPKDTSLAGLLNNLMTYKDVNVILSHYEFRGRIFVKYRVYTKFYAAEKLVDVNEIVAQSSGNFSLFRELFKRELVASILEAVKGDELFEGIDSIMSSRGILDYDVYLAVRVDDDIKLLVQIYVHSPSTSLEDLVSLAYRVKSLSNYISVVVLIEHPGWLRYILLPRKYWEREFEIVGETPCCYGGMGASIWSNQVIYINYTCVAELGYAESEESLRRFAESIVSMLRNHEKYGEEFRKGYWILAIDLPPVVWVLGPAPRDTTAEEQTPATQIALQARSLAESTVVNWVAAAITAVALMLVLATLLAKKRA